jgi:hypothetical protein
MNADTLAAKAFETPPYDPYLAWSFATGFAGHTSVVDGVGWVPLLMELTPAQFSAVWAMPGLRIPSLYTGGDGFVSARVACDRLLDVQAQVTHMEFSRPLPETPGLGRPPIARAKGSPVLAVIDRGCAFLNTAFRELDDPTRTRLLAVWDQGQAPGSGRWQRPSGMGYGRELV